MLFLKDHIRNDMSHFKLLSLSLWHKPFARRLAKFVSIIVTLTFVFPYLSWAFQAQTFQSAKLGIAFNNQFIEIPRQFGRLIKSFQGKNGLVVYIQDLHCNLEVQANIAGLIAHMAKNYDLKLAAVEGAGGTIDVGKLSSFPEKAVKEEVGKYFMQQGKITGPEFYAATGKHAIALEGIEDEASYQANRQAVERFLNNESQGQVFDLRETLEALKPRVYGKALSAHDRHRTAFRRGDESLLTYSVFLCRAGRQAGIGRDRFPQLQAYVSKRVNIFPSKVDSDQLYAEIETLEAALRQGLYRSREAIVLDDLQQRLDVVEKMVNISVSPEELAKYRAHPEAFRVQVFLDFIRSQASHEDLALDAQIYQLDNYLQDAAAFYKVADDRSLAFVANTLEKMQKHQTKMAVLVTGGYHSREVLEALRQQGISYLCVKPRLSRPDIVNPYFSLLKHRGTSLEKMLSQNQNILSLPSSFPVKRAGRIVHSKYVHDFKNLLDLKLKEWLLVKLLGRRLREISRLALAHDEVVAAYLENNPKIKINWEKARGNPERQAFLFPFENTGVTVLIRPQGDKWENQKLLEPVTLNGKFEIVVMASTTAGQIQSEWLGSDAGQVQSGARLRRSLLAGPGAAMLLGPGPALLLNPSATARNIMEGVAKLLSSISAQALPFKRLPLLGNTLNHVQVALTDVFSGLLASLIWGRNILRKETPKTSGPPTEGVKALLQIPLMVAILQILNVIRSPQPSDNKHEYSEWLRVIAAAESSEKIANLEFMQKITADAFCEKIKTRTLEDAQNLAVFAVLVQIAKEKYGENYQKKIFSTLVRKFVKNIKVENLKLNEIFQAYKKKKTDEIAKLLELLIADGAQKSEQSLPQEVLSMVEELNKVFTLDKAGYKGIVKNGYVLLREGELTDHFEEGLLIQPDDISVFLPGNLVLIGLLAPENPEQYGFDCGLNSYVVAQELTKLGYPVERCKINIPTSIADGRVKFNTTHLFVKTTIAGVEYLLGFTALDKMLGIDGIARLAEVQSKSWQWKEKFGVDKKPDYLAINEWGDLEVMHTPPSKMDSTPVFTMPLEILNLEINTNNDVSHALLYKFIMDEYYDEALGQINIGVGVSIRKVLQDIQITSADHPSTIKPGVYAFYNLQVIPATDYNQEKGEITAPEAIMLTFYCEYAEMTKFRAYLRDLKKSGKNVAAEIYHRPPEYLKVIPHIVPEVESRLWPIFQEKGGEAFYHYVDHMFLGSDSPEEVFQNFKNLAITKNDKGVSTRSPSGQTLESPLWDRYFSRLPPSLRLLFEELIFRVMPLILIISCGIVSQAFAAGIVVLFTAGFLFIHKDKGWDARQWLVATLVTAVITVGFFGLSLWTTPGSIIAAYVPGLSQPMAGGILGMFFAGFVHDLNNRISRKYQELKWPELSSARRIVPHYQRVADKEMDMGLLRNENPDKAWFGAARKYDLNKIDELVGIIIGGGRKSCLKLFSKNNLSEVSKKALALYTRKKSKIGLVAKELAPDLHRMDENKFFTRMKLEEETEGFLRRTELNNNNGKEVIIWEYADGTVIRYKSRDKFTGLPIAVIEVQKDTTERPYNLKDIAFKVGADGSPLPKDPAHINNPFPKQSKKWWKFCDLLMARDHIQLAEAAVQPGNPKASAGPPLRPQTAMAEQAPAKTYAPNEPFQGQPPLLRRLSRYGTRSILYAQDVRQAGNPALRLPLDGMVSFFHLALLLLKTTLLLGIMTQIGSKGEANMKKSGNKLRLESQPHNRVAIEVLAKFGVGSIAKPAQIRNLSSLPMSNLTRLSRMLGYTQSGEYGQLLIYVPDFLMASGKGIGLKNYLLRIILEYQLRKAEAENRLDIMLFSPDEKSGRGKRLIHWWGLKISPQKYINILLHDDTSHIAKQLKLDQESAVGKTYKEWAQNPDVEETRKMFQAMLDVILKQENREQKALCLATAGKLCQRIPALQGLTVAEWATSSSQGLQGEIMLPTALFRGIRNWFLLREYKKVLDTLPVKNREWPEFTWPRRKLVLTPGQAV